MISNMHLMSESRTDQPLQSVVSRKRWRAATDYTLTDGSKGGLD